MEKKKKILIITIIFGLVIIIIGGILVFWNWRSTEERENSNRVDFTIEKDFSCAASVDEAITSRAINVIPTEVNDNTTGSYIKREIKVMPTITKDGKTIYMDLWLDIKKLSDSLSSSSNLMYVLNTSSTDKDTGVIISGNFGGFKANNRVKLFTDKNYSSTTTETYYLWIWLDAKETNSGVANRSFELSLNGSCVDQKEEPNAPVLDDGMIPVVFDTSNGTVVKTVSSTDSSWYNYSNQEWANVVLVKTIGTQTRDYYKNNSGVEVNQSDILAYYVWIPRYKYQIWSIDDNNKSGEEQTIEIIFEDKNSISTGTQIGEYLTHPAFWWDNDSDGVRDEGEELSGIWVGKFETTGTIDSPTILPDVTSLANQNVSTLFATAQKLGGTTYGVTTNADSHMIKNSEWGAAIYLSHSKYGANREIYMNNSSGLYTGRSGGNVGGQTQINNTYTDQTSTEKYNSYGYYTWDGYLLDYNTNTKSSTRNLTKAASTTGNITGIYDMSGGADEFVMGYYGAESTTWGATSHRNYAGFNSKPDSKYYNNYTTISALTACNGGMCYGHGLSEVSDWYSDWPGDTWKFVNGINSWFCRGGGYFSGSDGGEFIFSHTYGGAVDNIGFRTVISLIEV